MIAAKARLEATHAQLETAEALYRQALEQRSAGVIAQTDLNRAQIEARICGTPAIWQRKRLIGVSMSHDRKVPFAPYAPHPRAV